MSDFRRFWLAESVSGFGTYITTIALQVLVVATLGGTATDVGLLNASRWLPYLLLGLVVGALIDRRRRRPVLVATDLGRGILLGLIPLLWLLGALSLPVLLVIVAAIGVLTLLNDSSTQSYLPRLVPREGLLGANARLDQSAAVAQTSGPLIAGGLVSLVGAPLAVLVDAATYLFSAIVQAGIRVVEPPPVVEKLHLRRDIAEGLRWVYRHRTLAPAAITSHVWFLFNSMLTTAFVPFVLLSLGLSALELGIAFAAAGVTGLLGALLSTRLGLRWGVGPVVIAGHLIMAGGWAVIALVPSGNPWITVALLAVGQGLYGFALGIQNANEMGYRQAVTPDELQGRVNTTIRSINRAAIVLGAPLGGILADSIGYRPTFWIAIAGFVLVAVALALSPFRSARH
jgi:MFS family permease